ncbi:DUF4157 domain-containing protein [Streptomyces sp. NPDC091215]|uniref:eCIS core domain-containing protein n=1 Tax=Streptomyces sp. NPDC091215 TaxID=3155192 RepID=UPI003435E807
MHAHEDDSARQREAGAPGTARRAGEGPAAAPRPGAVASALLALQRAAGNAAVTRAIEADRHRHGPHCGHGEQPTVQRRSSVFDAVATPGDRLDAGVRRKAEQAYGMNFDHVRVHSGTVAQRSAREYGAHAYTVGHDIVLSRRSVDDETMFHELDHVRQQSAGAVAGTPDGTGVAVSHRDDPFEQASAANGRRVAQGQAPDLGRPTGGSAGAAVQRAPATAVPQIQRAPATAVPQIQRAGEPKGKGRAAEPAKRSSETQWERHAKAIGELVKACTCEQPMKQWGRVDEAVMVHYPRSYAGHRSAQSLRHAARRLYRAVTFLEEREKARAAKDEKEQKDKDAKGAAKPKQEEEIEAMLFNGHLVFAGNLNQTVERLHAYLLDQGAQDATEEDAKGQSLRDALYADFDNLHYDADDERNVASSRPGKRRAPAGDSQGAKRARTGKASGAAENTEDEDAILGNVAEQRRRDRSARAKIGEGLRPRPVAQPLPSVPLDVDGSPVSESDKRDNATTRALRRMTYVRKVDISTKAAQHPSYRDYLAKLLAKDDTDFADYAYLLHNGDSDEVLHAEQQLLMFLHHAGVTGDTPHDVALIRGRKRPCKACLALLDYFRDRLGIKLAYNPNGNHFFQNALGSIAQNFPEFAADTTESDTTGSPTNWFGANMTDGRRMYVSTVGGARPTDENIANGAATESAQGGWEQELRLERTDDGKVRYPRGVGLVPMNDTPSNSEPEESQAESDADLVSATRQLTLKPAPRAPSAPRLDPAELERLREEQFVGDVVPLLEAAMTPEFRRELAKRTASRGSGKFDVSFPETLLPVVKDLLARDAATKKRIADHLTMTSAALDKRLKNMGSAGKQAKDIKLYAAKRQRIEQAMTAAGLSDRWRAVSDGATWNPDLPEDLQRTLFEIMNGDDVRISWTSLARFLKIPSSTFKRHVDRWNARWGESGDDAGEGPAA